MKKVPGGVDSDSSCLLIGKAKTFEKLGSLSRLMRLRTQIPFSLTSKPLNSFEFVFHGEPENENFSIGMENEEKPQKINLPCSNRISLTLPLSLSSFQLSSLLNWNVFLISTCKGKYSGVYFGLLVVMAPGPATKTFKSVNIWK